MPKAIALLLIPLLCTACLAGSYAKDKTDENDESQKVQSYADQKVMSEDDMPADYLGADGTPTIELITPVGKAISDLPTSSGISESAFFTVDLKKHLGLADGTDTYDIFLWLEDVMSEVVSLQKPAEEGHFKGALLYDKPTPAAQVKLAAVNSSSVQLTRSGNNILLKGRIAATSASVIAFVVETQTPVWTTLDSNGESGFEFTVNLQDLIPDLSTNPTVLALVIADGQRLPLARIPAS